MDKYKDKHPSYGLISFNRTSGDAQLFGSDTPIHGTYVTLRIKAAYTEPREDGGVWIRAGQQYVQVSLSAAQFAQLLLAMDQGEGIPCTIERLMGAPVPPPPLRPTRPERIREEFKARIEALSTTVRGLATDVDTVLADGNATNKVRARVRDCLRPVTNAILDGIPHMATAYTEATVAAETALHAEAAALRTVLLERLGLAGIKNATGIKFLDVGRDGQREEEGAP